MLIFFTFEVNNNSLYNFRNTCCLFEETHVSLQFSVSIFLLSAEDGISSVAANLQQLNLRKDDQAAPSEEDNPPVIIPNHLQLHTPDCLNLSFGSFGSGPSGTGAAFSATGSFTTRPLKSDLEETSTAADISSIGHSDSRYAFVIVVPTTLFNCLS
jgi:hypothetical protein